MEADAATAVRWVTIAAASGLVAAIATLALLRFYVLVVNPRSIQGTDLHMLRWCRRAGTRGWLGFHLSFRDGDFARIRAAVTDAIADALQQPDSDFRRGVDVAARRWVTHHDRSVADLVETVTTDTEFFRLYDLRNRELVFRFHEGRRLLGVLFDHTVWDGIRVVNETLMPAIDGKPFDDRLLLRDRYLPVVAEILQLRMLALLAWRRLRHRPMRTLADPQAQTVVCHRIPVAEVRALRRRSRVRFAAALVALWAQRLFAALPPERGCIRFGVLVGMANPRFRNNYSILMLDVRRAGSVEETARAVERQMRRRAVEILPMYHLLSHVEIQSLLKRSLVDCLFSPTFFERGSGVSLAVDGFSFYNVPTSCPLYSFACSLDDTITISTTHNAAELPLAAFAADAVERYDLAPGGRLVVAGEDQSPPAPMPPRSAKMSSASR